MPGTVRVFVHARRMGRTLFVLRAFGFRPVQWKGHAPAAIHVAVTETMTPAKLRRFVEHCHRFGLADMRLGLPGVGLGRFSRRRH